MTDISDIFQSQAKNLQHLGEWIYLNLQAEWGMEIYSRRVRD
jgi:hypothetical protein